jgi:hypothetical protein
MNFRSSRIEEMVLARSRSLVDDAMRVSIRDLNGHLIRVLDLKIGNCSGPHSGRSWNCPGFGDAGKI